MELRLDAADYALLDGLLADALRQTNARLSGHQMDGREAEALAERAARIREMQSRMTRSLRRQRGKGRP